MLHILSKRTFLLAQTSPWVKNDCSVLCTPTIAAGVLRYPFGTKKLTGIFFCDTLNIISRSIEKAMTERVDLRKFYREDSGACAERLAQRAERNQTETD